MSLDLAFPIITLLRTAIERPGKRNRHATAYRFISCPRRSHHLRSDRHGLSSKVRTVHQACSHGYHGSVLHPVVLFAVGRTADAPARRRLRSLGWPGHCPYGNHQCRRFQANTRRDGYFRDCDDRWRCCRRERLFELVSLNAQPTQSGSKRPLWALSCHPAKPKNKANDRFTLTMVASSRNPKAGPTLSVFTVMGLSSMI